MFLDDRGDEYWSDQKMGSKLSSLDGEEKNARKTTWKPVEFLVSLAGGTYLLPLRVSNACTTSRFLDTDVFPPPLHIGIPTIPSLLTLRV